MEVWALRNLDEIFGDQSFISEIAFTKGATGLAASGRLSARLDYILWYSRHPEGKPKYRQLYELKREGTNQSFAWMVLPNGEYVRASSVSGPPPPGTRYGQDVSLTKPGPGAKFHVEFQGRNFDSGQRWWGTTKPQLERAIRSGRIVRVGNALRHLRYLDESDLTAIGNLWEGYLGQKDPVYVVQTNTENCCSVHAYDD